MNSEEFIQSEQRRRLRLKVSRAVRTTGEFQGFHRLPRTIIGLKR